MNTKLANLSGNEMMSYNASNNSLMAGGNQVGIGQESNLCCDYFYHYYPYWYPSYHYVEQKSKIEQAFKIVGKLIEKNLIDKELTVKQFMKIVNEIAEVI
jgi:hypothetical protein